MKRVAWGLALLMVAGVCAFGVQGRSPQGERTVMSSLDLQKKDAWRFLDEDLGKVLADGSAAYAKGDFQAAARHYLFYLYRNGQDGRAVYHLARCYARLGDAETAVQLLTRAAGRGFVLHDLLRTDDGLKTIRETKVFGDFERQVSAMRERAGARIGVIGPRVNTCRVRLPAGRTPGKAYPLLIGLHGNGGSADTMMLALTPAAFPGMICAAPEGLYPRDDLSFQPGGHFGWFVLTPDKKLWRNLDAATSDSILAVIDEVTKTCPVSKVVLLGFSQGVSAAYLAALRRPERVAAVVAFAGIFPEEEVTPEEIKAGSRIRVLIGHGTADSQVEMSTSEHARDLLRGAGYQVQWSPFEGGHALPSEVLRTAGEWIRSWL